MSGDSDSVIACILIVDICYHTQTHNIIVDDLQENITDCTIRKTLYSTRDNVVELSIGEHLMMVNPTSLGTRR